MYFDITTVLLDGCLHIVTFHLELLTLYTCGIA